MKTSITIPILRTAASLFLMLICSVTAWAEDPKTLSEATAADVGKVISTDGNIYPTQNDMQSGYAVAMIAYVDEQNHTGLAIALDNVYYFDENQQYKGQFQWAETTDAVITWATDKAITGGTWKMPTIQEWQQMLIGCGSEGEVSDNPPSNTFTYTGINNKLTAIDPYSKLQYSYWSATETSWDTESALTTYFDDSNGNTYVTFYGSKKVSTYGNPIRACLTFTTGGEGGETYTIDANTESINMPVSGTAEYTIAEGVTSFNIYDDGGAEGNYSNGCNGTVVLTAPKGCRLQLTGTITSESADFLVICDGTSTEDNELLYIYSYNYGEETDISTVTSSGESMRIYFESDDTNTSYNGLNLTVTVLSPAIIDSNTGSINMPQEGAEVYEIAEGVTSFNVYDDGGAEGNYSNDCNGTVTLIAPEGYKLQLTGSIETESYYDVLKVWDASDSSGEPVATLSGNTGIGPIFSTGESLTLNFHSGGSTNDAGLNLTVTVVNPNAKYTATIQPASGGNVTISDNTTIESKGGNSIEMYISPGNGYMIDDISAVDADGNIVSITGGKWHSGSPYASFTMPYADVTVTPTFTNARTLEEGLYVNMPATSDAMRASIPEGVQSFKLYDNGGQNGNYSSDLNSTVVLIAPENYLLQLTGTITAYTYEKLTVKDGQYYDSTTLLNEGSSSNGTATDIGTIISSGRYLRIIFDTYSSAYSGLDLTVKLIDNAAENDINITPDNNGSVVAKVDGSEATTAKANDIVTLTATPAEGYMLSSITVTDDNDNPVSVTGGTWYDNTATFTMPATAVTVTPVFADIDDSDLSINIPADESTISATIPEGISTFKVYDDGGADGAYTGYGIGYLVLTAATGKQILLTGTITTNSSTTLSVWDGTDTSDDEAKLLDNKYSSDTGVATSIGILCNTGQSMTLKFHSSGYNLKSWAGLDLTVTQVDLNLSDRADNTAAITGKNGATEQSAVLTGRTLYKDGKWNTLCLPFDVTISGSALDGAEARELTDASISGTTLNLTFGQPVSVLKAGTPYIIKWTKDYYYKDNDTYNIVSPVFKGVTVSNAANDFDNNVSGDSRVRFVGSYATTTFSGNDYSILLMGGGNKLYYPASGSGLGAQRAYFKVGEDGTQQARSITGFNISFDNNDITGISGVIGNSGASNGLRPMDNDQWYDLNGRRLNGIPSRKGVYLNNGRKVVIK